MIRRLKCRLQTFFLILYVLALIWYASMYLNHFDTIVPSSTHLKPDGGVLLPTKAKRSASNNAPRSLSRRNCEWKHKGTLNHCYKILSPQVQGKPIWIFLGDSTMRHTFDSLEELIPYNHTLSKLAIDRCGSLGYFHFPFGNWVAPNFTLGEGPVAYGFEHIFCPDAALCFNKRHISHDDTITRHYHHHHHSRFVEFLTVEFALDVELPTPWTRTTQETVALYLKNQTLPSNDTVCVVNTGTHDMAIPMMTTELYVGNVKRYLSLLQPFCGNIIWPGLSATENQENRPQRNYKLEAWNQAVNDMLRASHPTIFRIDVWKKSLKSPHFDNVHMYPSTYYTPLAALFANLMK
jgi:hypothetical protein